MIYKEDDEEEEGSKEIDQLNKVIANNLKLEITINKNLEEAETIIKQITL